MNQMDMNNDNKNDRRTGINEPDLQPMHGRRQKCRNCRQLVEVKGDVCPNCGHYLYEKEVKYQPLDKKTVRKVKLILSIGLLAVFGLLVYFGVFKLEACSESAEIISSLLNR